MPSQINASNSGFGGIVSTGDSSGVLQLQTTGTTALTIDTSQNVGIGTSSPGNAKLNVQGFASYRGDAYTIASFSANSTLAPLNITQLNDGTIPSISAGQNSTGTWAAGLGFMTSGSERMRIDSSGNVGIGTTAPLSRLNLVASNAAAVTALTLQNSNSGFAANEAVDIDFGVGSSTTAGHGKLRVANTTATSGSNSYMSFYTRASDVLAEKMRIDSSGNVLVTNPAGLGYGTGSGGTVTQATSKSTAVTLNKPTGQITMNNAALASGAAATFVFNNSLLAATDILTVSVATFGGPYRATVGKMVSGSCEITVQNSSGGSLSDAIVINFAIIKGATS